MPNKNSQKNYFENDCVIAVNIIFLNFFGAISPINVYKKFFYMTILSFVILFFMSEITELFFIASDPVKTDLNALLANLKVTLVAGLSILKLLSLVVWRGDWLKIMQYVIRADKKSRMKAVEKDKVIIVKYTRYAKAATCIYATVVFTSFFSTLMLPVYNFFFSPGYKERVLNGTEHFIEVTSSWVPFNKNTVRGHLAASAIQASADFFGAGWIVCYDGLSMSVMVFICGELKLLKRSCSKIFNFNDVSDQVFFRIRDCHRRHLELIRHSTLFDSCLSPIMFLYMIMSSTMLCASIYQLIDLTENPLQRFLVAVYVIFGISQLFIYCWHGNEVFYASDETIRGLYESEWWKNKAYRKEVLLLTWQLDKRIKFTAGPFLTLTVTTFINILKGAYSYYTMMSTRN